MKGAWQPISLTYVGNVSVCMTVHKSKHGNSLDPAAMQSNKT